jgi:hypothetical protein
MQAVMTTCMTANTQATRECIHAMMHRTWDALVQTSTIDGLHAWFRACYPGNECWVDEWMDAHIDEMMEW